MKSGSGSARVQIYVSFHYQSNILYEVLMEELLFIFRSEQKSATNWLCSMAAALLPQLKET